MPKCPGCEKVITKLRAVRSGIEHSELVTYEESVQWITKAGNPKEKTRRIIDYEVEEFESDGLASFFYCPMCGKELFKNEDDAITFLESK